MGKVACGFLIYMCFLRMNLCVPVNKNTPFNDKMTLDDGLTWLLERLDKVESNQADPVRTEMSSDSSPQSVGLYNNLIFMTLDCLSRESLYEACQTLPAIYRKLSSSNSKTLLDINDSIYDNMKEAQKRKSEKETKKTNTMFKSNGWKRKKRSLLGFGLKKLQLVPSRTIRSVDGEKSVMRDPRSFTEEPNRMDGWKRVHRSNLRVDQIAQLKRMIQEAQVLGSRHRVLIEKYKRQQFNPTGW